MRTVNELKKLPASEILEAISLDAVNWRKLRETDLNTQYLERHPEISEVPDFILESNEALAMYYVQGSFQELLRTAIQNLQKAEAENETLKQAVVRM